MEALPLFLDTMFNTELSVIISVTFVLAFGEVIPQSLCTGPNQIKIACRCIPIVKFFMILLFPLAYPLAKLLDKVLGEKEEKKRLGEKELRTFIGLQQLEGNSEHGLDPLQIKIMTSLIDLNEVKVESVQTPLSSLPMVEKEETISKSLMLELVNSKSAFITVYSGQMSNVCGTFTLRRILQAVKDQNFRVSTFELKPLSLINGDKTCLQCLKQMTNGDDSLFFVTDQHGFVTGVITKEYLMGKVFTLADIDRKSGINEISNALIGVLGGRTRQLSSTKRQTITRTRRSTIL